LQAAGDSAPPSAGGEVNATTKSPLTGIPQIDYVHDPNLPRELNGYNLTDYPFYDRVPDEINFKCDGLHDGFYASIPHKCQVMRRKARHLSSEHNNVNNRNLLLELIWGMTERELRTSAANVVCKDVDVFGARNLLLGHFV
jgi:hypothetical protein